MGLFDKIFRPGRNRKGEEALRDAEGYFRTLTGYRPRGASTRASW